MSAIWESKPKPDCQDTTTFLPLCLVCALGESRHWSSPKLAELSA